MTRPIPGEQVPNSWAVANKMHKAGRGRMDQWRCVSCEHWEPQPSEYHGQDAGACRRIVDESPIPSDELAATWDYEGWSSGICTRASFGCVLWRARS